MEPPATGEPETTLQIPTLRIPLQGANISVQLDPNGIRYVEVGPIAISFVMPLEADNARTVARALAGGVDLDAPKLATSIRTR